MIPMAPMESKLLLPLICPIDDEEEEEEEFLEKFLVKASAPALACVEEAEEAEEAKEAEERGERGRRSRDDEGGGPEAAADFGAAPSPPPLTEAAKAAAPAAAGAHATASTLGTRTVTAKGLGLKGHRCGAVAGRGGRNPPFRGERVQSSTTTTSPSPA